MRIIFKIMSVLLIIISAIYILIGAAIVFGMTSLFESASSFGYASGSLGALGMFVSIAGVIIVVMGALMLYTGITGFRERMDKCRKFAFGFLILTALNFALAVFQNASTGSAVLWLIFFGAYYFLARACSKRNIDFY